MVNETTKWSDLDRSARNALWMLLGAVILPVAGILMYVFIHGIDGRDFQTNLFFGAIFVLMPVNVLVVRLAVSKRWDAKFPAYFTRQMRESWATAFLFSLFMMLMVVQPDYSLAVNVLRYAGAVIADTAFIIGLVALITYYLDNRQAAKAPQDEA